jgi:hypothetical protein
MSNIVAAPVGGKGLRRPGASPVCRTAVIPAPTPEMYDLLALFPRGALPLSDVRPAAVATGLSMDLVENAISIASRRGELRIEAGHGGTVLARRAWP